MSYPGRENIYRATIRRMVLQSLEAQEQQFRQTHALDPDEALLTLLRQWAARHQHPPGPGSSPAEATFWSDSAPGSGRSSLRV